jgi:hypothetical protein
MQNAEFRTPELATAKGREWTRIQTATTDSEFKMQNANEPLGKKALPALYHFFTGFWLGAGKATASIPSYPRQSWTCSW